MNPLTKEIILQVERYKERLKGTTPRSLSVWRE